jgi:hypothetical protein
MSHISMVKYSKNDLGYIQVVTHANNKGELESIGFVDHIDKIKEPIKKAAKKTNKVVKDDK